VPGDFDPVVRVKRGTHLSVVLTYSEVYLALSTLSGIPRLAACFLNGSRLLHFDFEVDLQPSGKPIVV